MLAHPNTYQLPVTIRQLVPGVNFVGKSEIGTVFQVEDLNLGLVGTTNVSLNTRGMDGMVTVPHEYVSLQSYALDHIDPSQPIAGLKTSLYEFLEANPKFTEWLVEIGCPPEAFFVFSFENPGRLVCVLPA